MTEARSVLVTGASRGIGAAIALDLARRGYDVGLNDIARQKDALEGVASEIAGMGRRAALHFADVSNKAAVDGMAEDFLETFGKVDAIVNNAGILIAGEMDGLPEQAWDSVMDVNAKGSFMVIQAFLPAMKARGYGRIVNIASIGGKHGAPEQAHYSASKAAVMGFSRVLAQEVGPLGITVNSRLPGDHPHRHGTGEPGRSGRSKGLAGQDGHGAHRYAGGCHRTRGVLLFRRQRLCDRADPQRRRRHRVFLIAKGSGRTAVVLAFRKR